jgi:hypothetical protein
MKSEASCESVAARPVPEVRGYVLEEVIGRGGAGVVWRATQEGTLREVAVKFLGSWQGSGLAELRFEREAEIAGGLEHENIVRVFDSGESGSGRWLAMELVGGATLDGWVAGEDPPLRRRMEVFAGICAGVRHAHQRGVIHRDLKPGNVLMAMDGTPKVADFGLARRVDGESLEVTLTREGDVFGSLAWMAPEQVAGKWEEVDVLSDVYALGALLYSVVAGRPPVDAGLAPAALAAAIRAGDFVRLGRVRVGTPRDIETMVERCMAVEKGRRYQSVAEVEEEVRSWLRGDPIRARAASPFYWVGKKLRRHWVAAAAVVAVAGAGGAVAWRSWEVERERLAEQKALAVRDAARTAAVLHQAQELVAQMLREMRERFTEVEHPEWLEDTERRVAAFEWDIGGDGSGAFDPRRFRGMSALFEAETHVARGRWLPAMQSFHSALAQLKPLVLEHPGMAVFRNEVARARLGLSVALTRLRYHKEAYEEAAKAIGLLKPATGEMASPASQEMVVGAMEAVGEAVAEGAFNPGSALRIIDEAMVLGPVVAGPGGASEDEASWLARAERVRANLRRSAGDAAGSAVASGRALAFGRRAFEESGRSKYQARRMALVLVTNASVMADCGDGMSEADCLVEAVEILGVHAPKLDRYTEADPYVGVARGWGRHARRLAESGALDRAEKAGVVALDWWGRLLKARDGDRVLIAGMAQQRLEQGQVLRQQARVEEARVMLLMGHEGLKRALEAYTTGHSSTNLRCAEAAIELAELAVGGGGGEWLAAAESALVRPRNGRARLTPGLRELLERLEKRLEGLGQRVAGP